MIPKILLFTWKTTTLPRVMQRYYEKWEALHPGWEIKLWTDETMRAFVAASYPEFLATYDRYGRMIQRADSFRYLVLNRFGGVYSDLDVEPFISIDAMIEPLQCFVGLEPLEHISDDRYHAGLPYLMSNAFMGAEPGHPLFKLVVELLPRLADQETFFSTGPSMLTAAGLRMSRQDRPALLLPKVWSPQRDGGLPVRSDAALTKMLGETATLVGGSGKPVVSHKWLTTWVPWHARHSPLEKPFQVPTMIKWWLRRKRFRDLNAVKIPDPLIYYHDQTFAPAQPGPTVFVAVRLTGAEPLHARLAQALRGLSYPSSLLRFGFYSAAVTEPDKAAVRASVVPLVGSGEAAIIFGDGDGDVAARADNLLAEMGATASEKVLLVGGSIRDIPPDAIEMSLAPKLPVVAANCIDAEGKVADSSVFRYLHAPKFRILWKVGGLSGAVEPVPEQRAFLKQQRAFRLVPLDGIGDSFVLIDSKVIKAGARFTEERYKLHVGGEAFGIMARDLGFEVAGLPELVVMSK
ncbi:MAG: hypothetical protein JWN11_2152 [Hyphomicrobiales bacterium]|nr:hypothetical protein [Hyphomicrobiales bacterium]